MKDFVLGVNCIFNDCEIVDIFMIFLSWVKNFIFNVSNFFFFVYLVKIFLNVNLNEEWGIYSKISVIGIFN